MRQQTIPQFGFKPSAFGRHYIAAIGYVKQLVNGNGMKAESQLHLSTIHTFLELLQAPDTAYKINSLVGSLICNSQ